MRKPIVILALLLSVGIALGLWSLASRSSRQPPPTITFAGREPGNPYRPAAFYVTNNGPEAIYLERVQMQICYGERWITLLSKPIELAPTLYPTLIRLITPYKITQTNWWSADLEANGYRKIVTDWPADHPWRIRLTYKREAKGMQGFLERAKIAWRTKSFSRWRTRIWLTPSEQVLSSDILK